MSNKVQTRVFNLQAMDELARLYKSWAADYPESLKWKKSKAREKPWWDLAAHLCFQHDVPPPLMFFLCYGYTNYCPDEAEIPFSATTFRSEHIMLRALKNYRTAVSLAVRHLEPIYILEHLKELTLPHSIIDVSRLLAELSCRYFECMLMVRDYEFRKRGGTILHDALWDSMAYQMCEQNPFLLLRVAKTEKVRALAAVNAFFLSDLQPWHRCIWEGIASPHPLSQVELLAGTDPRSFYSDGRMRYTWPLHCITGQHLDVIDDMKIPLGLRLLDFRRCPKADLFLATKLGMARNGSPDPYMP